MHSMKKSGSGSPRFGAGGGGNRFIASPKSRKKEAAKDLLSMDDMNDKLMEKLTAEFEEVFHVDEPMLLVDDGPATTAEEEDRENEANMHEVSKANTVEEKQKFLDALK